MDSPIFKGKNIEKELFAEPLPELPMVAWYAPTRDDVNAAATGTPQLMKTPEEQLMFRRFNYAKRKLKLRIAELSRKSGGDWLALESAA